MKICFVYDRVNKWGGAERVLLNLHEIWPEAPLFTAVYDPKNAGWSNVFQIIPSFLNKIPFFRNHHELIPMLMPYAFESFDLSAYDAIISVTSAEAKGVLTGPDQLHICYLLTPTRYLWSHFADYVGKNWFKHQILKSLQRWDLVASTRPDKIVSISKAVNARCKEYYHRNSDAIIYPPVDTEKFGKDYRALPKPLAKEGFLVVSRLVPYKRVDLAILACNQLREQLLIVGTGSELKNLKRIAGPTVTFLGEVTDEKLNDLYHGAKALIFPQEEEFGITALEAQSAGIPVIAYKKGAAVETVVSEKTGIFFDKQTPQCLVEAISHLNDYPWYDKNIREHANQFSKQVFQTKFKQFVEVSWKNQNAHG